jgi:hypothetical protein
MSARTLCIFPFRDYKKIQRTVTVTLFFKKNRSFCITVANILRSFSLWQYHVIALRTHEKIRAARTTLRNLKYSARAAIVKAHASLIVFALIVDFMQDAR